MIGLFTFRFSLSARKATRDVLVIFPSGRTLEGLTVADALEKEIEANLVPDEVIVLVRDPSFAQALAALTGDAATTALRRLKGRAAVYLKTYNSEGAEVRSERVLGPDKPSKVSFKDIRRRAVTHIFRTRRGFVESTPTYHFENPSGRHTQRFIRLSNILVSGAEIAFIGFCALGYVPAAARVVYIDTPSLYAIVSAVNEHRASFDPAAVPLVADNFSSYDGLDRYQFGLGAEGVVLISASSSGGLAKRLVEEAGFAPAKVVHLLFLGQNVGTFPVVCDLERNDKENPEGFEAGRAVWEPDSCEACGNGSVAIRLQGDQFDIAGPQPSSLMMRRLDAHPGLSDLMQRMSGSGVFRIGLESGKRRRLLDIDANALLANPAFLERFDFLVSRSVPAGTEHVIYTDEGSFGLAERIRKKLGNGATVKASDVSTISSRSTSALVVVSSAIESGRCLQDISRDLRNIASKAPIIYLVGVSKSSGEPRRETLGATLIQTDLSFKHQFLEVEKAILPPSSDRSPWSAELDLFTGIAAKQLVTEPVEAYYEKRLAFLRARSETYVDGLFLENDPARPLTLQEGFVFWSEQSVKTHNQADVYYTMASVLQRLRANANTPGVESAIKSNWFQQTILAPGNFGRFNDDIIQASLLRAARPVELNYGSEPDDSREMARLISKIVVACDTPRGGAAAEFLLALATKRLQLMKDDLETVLELPPATLPFVAFLQALCGKVLG